MNSPFVVPINLPMPSVGVTINPSMKIKDKR